MADEHAHPIGALQDAVDGRLSADGRATLDAHLAGCEACRRELEALAWVKRQAAGPGRAATDVPADLEAWIRRVLDDEDAAHAAMAPGSPRSSAPGETGRRQDPARRTIKGRLAWLAAAAALALIVWFATRPASSSVPDLVASDFSSFAAGTLALELETADPPALESHLGRAGLGFPARVFDFGMMDYRLIGGGRHRVGGAPSALFAYEGGSTLRMVCQMYAGRAGDLPSPAERRTNEGVEFLVYRIGDVTLVFWQEGAIVCVLAANGDPEAAIRLAFAKAVRV
jgi:anti-sigma factor RsiW